MLIETTHGDLDAHAYCIQASGHAHVRLSRLSIEALTQSGVRMRGWGGVGGGGGGRLVGCVGACKTKR